jgi:O-antigen/teichoic acid export membrane protein
MSDPAAPPGGTGAALGTQLLRYSGIHSVGVVVSNVLAFAVTILVANFIDPDAFGQLGLLLFLSGLMTMMFTLASKQGTMKRTFGGDDDDEDDDEEDVEDLSKSPRRTLGTGLLLIAMVSGLGTLVTVAFAGPIADLLLGDPSQGELVIWAAVAGGAGALYRVVSIALWLERRPYPYIAVEASRPLLTLAAVVPLLIGGAGLEGAIAGTALGTALATAFAIVLLRGSWEFCFEPREALAIYRKGSIRVPLVLSMWLVGYADIFILSRFVSDADLGTYHLASRAGFLVAFLPGGYRKALRPLQKTTTFRAVEDEYGVGTARGIQLGYFVLMLIGVLLAVTVLAQVLVRVAPSSYSDAAPLIPLLSAGLVAPTVYRMLNKSVKYGNKRVPFIIGAVVAAILFVVFGFVLSDEIGVVGPPLAMIAGFTPPALFIFYRSQHGRTPIVLPWRALLTALALAIAIAIGVYLLDVGGGVPQMLIGIGAVVLWVVLLPFIGAVPSYHRAPLIEMVRGLVGRSAGATFDPALGLAALPRPQRRALRRAILGRKSPAGAIDGLVQVESGAEARFMVEVLRRTAVEGGTPGLPAGFDSTGNGERDQAIGEFLFAPGPIAERDQRGKRLINDGVAEAYDLHTLEATVAALRATPRQVWKDPEAGLAVEESVSSAGPNAGSRSDRVRS